MGGASDAAAWMRACREDGLPPAWIRPPTVSAATAVHPLPAAHMAGMERSIAAASLALDSLLRNAHPDPDEAEAPAAGLASGLRRQMSAVRPVPCPNASCGETLAIDAVVSEPRHLTCPSCSTGFCGSCGLAWTLDECGDSHVGRSCDAHAAMARAVAAAFAKTEALAAGELGAATKLCPACNAKIVRYRGHHCHQVSCKCGTVFCYACLCTAEEIEHMERRGEEHVCSGYCEPYTCDCVPCPTCAEGAAGREICEEECAGAPACVTCALGNRPETEEERTRREAQQAEALRRAREEHPHWSGPRRFRGDTLVAAASGRAATRRDPEADVRMRGAAARAREALQLLHAATLGMPASGPAAAAWAAGLDAGSACAVKEAVQTLALLAATEGSSPPAAAAAAPVAPASAGRFSDGFRPAFVASRGSMRLSPRAVPADLSFGMATSPPPGVPMPGGDRQVPSSLGPLLRVLGACASAAAPSALSTSTVASITAALCALFLPAAAASPEDGAQRAGWAAELASLEGVQALTSVLAAAAAGTLPVEHAVAVDGLVRAVLADEVRVHAAAGAVRRLVALRGGADSWKDQLPRELTEARRRFRCAGPGDWTAVVPQPGALRVDMRVRRGPTWQWGAQDGGPGNLGTVMRAEGGLWCTVRWDNGHRNGYRYNGGDTRDVEVVEQVPRPPAAPRDPSLPPATSNAGDLVVCLESHQAALVLPGSTAASSVGASWGEGAPVGPRFFYQPETTVSAPTGLKAAVVGVGGRVRVRTVPEILRLLHEAADSLPEAFRARAHASLPPAGSGAPLPLYYVSPSAAASVEEWTVEGTADTEGSDSCPVLLLSGSGGAVVAAVSPLWCDVDLPADRAAAAPALGATLMLRLLQLAREGRDAAPEAYATGGASEASPAAAGGGGSDSGKMSTAGPDDAGVHAAVRRGATAVLALFAAISAPAPLTKGSSSALNDVFQLSALPDAGRVHLPAPGSRQQRTMFSRGRVTAPSSGRACSSEPAREGGRGPNGAFASEEDALAEAIRLSTLEAAGAFSVGRPLTEEEMLAEAIRRSLEEAEEAAKAAAAPPPSSSGGGLPADVKEIQPALALVKAVLADRATCDSNDSDGDSGSGGEEDGEREDEEE